METMKRISVIFSVVVLVFCCFSSVALAYVESNAYLEAAFSLLEAGNLFLEQYNLLGDNLVEAKYERGMPYFFAGNNAEAALKVRVCVQESSYYKLDKQYLYGLDCKGFTQWVQRQAGVEEHEPIATLLYKNRGEDLLKKRTVQEWPDFFLPGDLLAIDHGPYHVMMYIGTPADYGLTKENAPEIADYLEYPLFIHCGANPFYTDRYKEYIREMGYTKCNPPDGGVTVSIMGMEQAPHYRDDFGRDFWYFQVCDQHLPVLSLEQCTQIAWVPQP